MSDPTLGDKIMNILEEYAEHYWNVVEFAGTDQVEECADKILALLEQGD
jgi:hypothetical protein